MNNLIICGLPGSGKTTVGKLVSYSLKRIFIDTDDLIQQNDRYSRSPRQITIEEGEENFRKMECLTVENLQNVRDSVISTGGGTLLNSHNLAILKSLGTIIYLQANPELLLERILKNGMPTYLNPNNVLVSFQNLAHKRQSVYEQACHYTIQIDGLPPEGVMDRILVVISSQ
jgi:shikimate kinase